MSLKDLRAEGWVDHREYAVNKGDFKYREELTRGNAIALRVDLVGSNQLYEARGILKVRGYKFSARLKNFSLQQNTLQPISACTVAAGIHYHTEACEPKFRPQQIVHHSYHSHGD